ncbi:hypothetical protein [Selenomonas sp. AE3005]|uniref:hypothetical protein n=1 Tax=Selenomonas sp. AE3005 TaxID=1485543 RepID=UPI0025D63E13|nr:hypothetical protein [Selenomonas sp. AE3005]
MARRTMPGGGRNEETQPHCPPLPCFLGSHDESKGGGGVPGDVDADSSKQSQVALVVSVHQSRNAAGRAKRRLTFDLSAAHLASFYAALR